MASYGPYPLLNVEEVVQGIKHGQTVAFSGFTPAGAAKAVPRAIARPCPGMHEQGAILFRSGSDRRIDRRQRGRGSGPGQGGILAGAVPERKDDPPADQ